MRATTHSPEVREKIFLRHYLEHQLGIKVKNNTKRTLISLVIQRIIHRE